ARTVDEDVADLKILHRRFERTEAERLVHDLIDESLAFGIVQRFGSRTTEAGRQLAHLAPQAFRLELLQTRKVQTFDELFVNQRLELLEADRPVVPGRFSRRGGWAHN